MKLMVSEDGCRVFLKPGQGKTASVLKAFDILKKKGFVDALLVLAPLRVVATSWPQEIEKWADFEHLTYTTIHGGPAARVAAMNTRADIYLMNVEGIIGKEWAPVNKNKGKKHPVTGNVLRPQYAPNPVADKWLTSKRLMLVVDESTKFKNSQAARSQALKMYLPHFDRRVILTGTPRPGKLEDLFFQCYITDFGEDLGTFVTNFRGKYMMPHPSGFGWQEQPGAAERVAAKIAPTTIQIEATEIVPTQTNIVWVPMPATARSKYNEIKRELLTEIDGREIMAPNAGVLYGKLRQLAQGAIFYRDIGEDKPGWLAVHDSKLDALENILEELNGEPAFCLYAYTHDYERINARLGYAVPRVGGGVPASVGAAHCRAFAAGDLPLLLGHPQSVAHGIDGLQNNCSNVIWFGSDPSWENTYQANLRIARPGSTAEQVNIYHILTDCGVERSVVQKASDKELSEVRFLQLLRENLIAG